MSLRTLHLAFVLLVIIGADLFGIWSVYTFVQGGDALLLGLGVLSLLGGLGLVFYGIKVMRFFDCAQIH